MAAGEEEFSWTILGISNAAGFDPMSGRFLFDPGKTGLTSGLFLPLRFANMGRFMYPPPHPMVVVADVD